MAKPKNPLLSLGARGTIGDVLTFQKRGRLTIARQKPIPTDPQTDLQLAQRQVYREAVAAWNALTPEEKEAYRGVCPGLTPYQCYMKTALAVTPPVPPPEEYTEEQDEYNASYALHGGASTRWGQRLTIPNRRVAKLGFWLHKVGGPTGDVTFQIRRIDPDEVIISKLLGDAEALATEATYYEKTFDTPTVIDEEVRIVTDFSGGDVDNKVAPSYQNTDVKPAEYVTRFALGTWNEHTTVDCAYRYKYYEVE